MFSTVSLTKTSCFVGTWPRLQHYFSLLQANHKTEPLGGTVKAVTEYPMLKSMSHNYDRTVVGKHQLTL